MTITLSGLEGKVAVVTGAGRMRGFGRGIALKLADGGCDVVVTESNRPASEFPDDELRQNWRGGDSVVEEIEAKGRRARRATLDIADEGAVDAFCEEVIDLFGRADIVVNNAAAPVGSVAPVTGLSTATWRSKMSVNLDGAFYMSRAFGRRMTIRGEGGSIVNISSIAGKAFSADMSAYSASKAGLQALTACMAVELAKDQIRVNAVCPGFVVTSHSPDMTPEALAKSMESVGPRLRVGTVKDIANAVAFLCSNEGSWITGQAINVDGGRVVGW